MGWPWLPPLVAPMAPSLLLIFSLVVTLHIWYHLASLTYAYRPKASNWAPDASMGEVCTSVLFIILGGKQTYMDVC